MPAASDKRAPKAKRKRPAPETRTDAPAATATTDAAPPIRSALEATIIGDLFRVDMNGTDAAAIQWYRGRYLSSPRRTFTPTDDDLRRARMLVDRLATAIVMGGAPVWERITRAYEIMREIDEQDLRVAACVHGTEQAVKSWHSREGEARTQVVDSLMRFLAFYEPAFAKLTSKEVREEIRGAKPRETNAKGGRGNIGAATVLASLALSVGAFGYAKRDDESPDHAVTRVKRALVNATRRGDARLSKPTRRT